MTVGLKLKKYLVLGEIFKVTLKKLLESVSYCFIFGKLSDFKNKKPTNFNIKIKSFSIDFNLMFWFLQEILIFLNYVRRKKKKCLF